MIAIAGAKGGCGKTTTTIGLAEAFARTGTPSVAVDADRQLPNLHVTAGVDREPTLAALESTGTKPTAERRDASESDEPAGPETTVRTIAHRSPRTATAGIVPAPTPSDGADVKSLLERVQTADAVQPFVDCPSGAGPDAVEPIAAADGVVVVTTDGDRAIAAAETTIEMARRLEVPILGAVVNRSDAVPTAVESWIDVPTLGVVPETETPLEDEPATGAYDAIVRTLQTHNATVRTPPTYDDSRLRTGIDALDHRLGGGLQPGTVAALVADPASRSEQLLAELTAPRGTLYLTTERSTTNVRRAIEAAPVSAGTPTIRRVDGDDALEDATALLENLPDGATLIVDPMAELERREKASYVSFLNDLTDRMVETDGIALLHCLRAAEPPANRRATTHAVDAVFDLQTPSVEPGVESEPYLTVPKFRADRIAEPIELAEDARPVPVEPETNSA